MSGLSLTLLGPPEVRLDGHLLKFRSRKALALLAYLATEGGVRSRDELVALFWPESDESRGRTALRSTLSYIKEPLGRNGGGDAGYLLIERNALGFDFVSDYALDLAVLRSAFEVAQHAGRENGREEEAAPLLEEAIRACRGDFMQGFQLKDAPEFDYWLDVEREGWRRRADAVFDRLSQLRIEAGEVVRAEEVADRWAKRSRTNEVAHRRLMEARFEGGDRAGAIEAYEGLRATLEREIGVAPGPETQALAERFRTKPGRGASAWPPAGAPAGAAPPSGAPERGGVAPELPFVGRTEEFAALVSAYREARADGTRALAVVGEGGVGKTRLIEEFLGWAYADGGDVLHGRAFETEEHLPYGVLVDALRARIEHERAPDDLLPDVWLAELSRLLPELRDRYPDLPEPASDETTARTGLFEAIARLGEALAERTTVIVIVEDAHRADTATLDALRYAARRWAETGAPVLVLVSLRPEVAGPEHAASQWLHGLGRVLPVGHLALEPLTLEDTAGLLRKLSPADGGEGYPEGDLERFAGWMHRETGGKPFFLAETLKALVERGALLSGTEGGRWVVEVTPEARGAETPESLLPRG